MKISIIKTKTGNLPDAPDPTRPVRVITGRPMISKFGALSQKEFEERLRRAREKSLEARKDSWTEEEMDTVRSMVRNGHDHREIAEQLPRRTAGAVKAKIRKMREVNEL